MTAPRLIRLVPTGVCHEGIEFVEPEEVQPLTDEQLDQITAEQWGKHAILPAHRAFARAIEQAHGIGRRLDA